MAAQTSIRNMLLYATCFWVLPTLASRGTPGSGFIGYGITMYKPTCATACRDTVSNPLNCDGHADNHHMVKRMGGMSMEKPSPECYATNDPFLQSVAYCISTHCQDVPVWKLEQWWTKRIPGRMPNQPIPKETYQQTLARIVTHPDNVTASDEMLMETSLVAEESYLANYNGDFIFEKNEATHVRYGLILLTTGAGIPLVLSLLRFIPFPRALVSRFSAIFIDPPVFGTLHRVPWLNSFLLPTRGQAFFIAYLWIINLILCSVGYESARPNSWFATTTQEVATYISYRTGVLSFANLALMVLYAGRNNVLLWVTNWSHSTFLLLHRWIAFICVLQACVHSAILLQIYVNQPDYDYMSESKKPYWVWGIVATLGLVVLLPTSILPIRRKVYEIFLAWHVVLSFFVLIGGYYHVVLCFGHQWGYETWLLIAFACWAFDRVARILRLSRNGVNKARVTIIDEDYVRLDIPGVSASGQVYLYFPTLTWRVWENHPFSVAGALVAKEGIDTHSSSSKSSFRDDEKHLDPEIKPVIDSDSDSPARRSSAQKALQLGLTFFIRTHTGLTSKLRNRKTLPVLIESSYGHSFVADHSLTSYPNLVCIAGGVGITAILPFLAGHIGRRNLYWGVRTGGLVEAMRDMLDEPAYSGAEVEIVKGERMDLRGILEKEIGADGGVGTAVVVSGPPSMADDVRFLVCELAGKQKGAVVCFVEESYSW